MGMHSHYNSEWVPGGYAWDVQQVVFPSGLFKQTLFWHSEVFENSTGK